MTCFQPPEGLESSFQELEVHVAGYYEFNPALPITADSVSRDAWMKGVQSQAAPLLAIIRSSHRKYTDTLFAHSGSTEDDTPAQSGVFLEGRKRGKADVIRKAEKQKRALEAESEEDEEIITPKKKV